MIKHLWFKLWVGMLNQGLPLVATKCHWLIKGPIALFKAKTTYHWLSTRIYKTLGRLTIQCSMIKVVCSNFRNSIWIRRNISIISHNCKNVWLLNDILTNICVTCVPLAKVWISYLTNFSFQNQSFVI
jgi:hypothetical protein